MNPADLAAAFLALSPADRAAFARAAGLTTKTHTGAKRTKNGIHIGTRALVAAREGYCCYWCGADLTKTGMHFDHLTSERLAHVYLMGVASCPQCNVNRPKDDAEARRSLDHIAGLDMGAAYSLRDSKHGEAMHARIRAASGMGKPAADDLARDSFPF